MGWRSHDIYVLIREEQNHYGYLDPFVQGVFVDPSAARRLELAEQSQASEQGLIVEDDESPDWQVSWRIEEHGLG